MVTKAVSYLRVSGRGQVEGDGFPRQRAAIEKYCQNNAIEIVDEYRDEGISGKTELENRPGLAACLDRVENNGVKLILVESADRLARDSMIAEIIIRQFQKAGCIVISAAAGIDLTAGDDSNPTAQLIRQILAAVAQFDRCVTVLKLRASRDRKRNAGLRVEGVKPYGHHNFPAEGAVIATMRTLQANGKSFNEIACALGSSTRSGKPWSPKMIARVLKRIA